jgi:hypothetical protein
MRTVHSGACGKSRPVVAPVRRVGAPSDQLQAGADHRQNHRPSLTRSLGVQPARLAFVQPRAASARAFVWDRSADHIRASSQDGSTQRPDTWLHPNASRKRQIPLASRAPSIHGTKRRICILIRLALSEQKRTCRAACERPDTTRLTHSDIGRIEIPQRSTAVLSFPPETREN